MTKKIIISDIHISDKQHLDDLRFFLNAVVRGDVRLYFAGNGIEYFYGQPEDEGIRLINDIVARFPGSKMVRGNHDVIRPKFVDVVPVYNFTHLGIYHVEDGVLLTHNIDTILHQDTGEVSGDYPLSRIVLKETTRALVSRSGDKPVELISKPEDIGKLVQILSKLTNHEVSLLENKDYLERVSSAMDSLGANLAFVGHEHNIDMDITMVFELGDIFKWKILQAGAEYLVKNKGKYVFVTPHFRGLLSMRMMETERAIHYLEYDPKTRTISYKKLFTG